jgi:hypothetical protein
MSYGQHVVYSPSGSVAHIRQHVAVDVEREAHIIVTQKLLDELHANDLFERERHASVPEVIEPEGVSVIRFLGMPVVSYSQGSRLTRQKYRIARR